MNHYSTSLAVVVSTLIFALLASGVQAQQEMEVKIGPPSPSVASHSHDHNITVGSLNRGKTEYTLRSKSQDRHKANLTAAQRGDLIDGTTVIIRTGKDGDGGDLKEHQHQLTITVKGEEQESSGW